MLTVNEIVEMMDGLVSYLRRQCDESFEMPTASQAYNNLRMTVEAAIGRLTDFSICLSAIPALKRLEAAKNGGRGAVGAASTDGLSWFSLKTGEVTPAPRREDVPVADAQDKTPRSVKPLPIGTTPERALGDALARLHRACNILDGWRRYQPKHHPTYSLAKAEDEYRISLMEAEEVLYSVGRYMNPSC